MPSIVYKEWLPDQPELGNPGLLRAENVLPTNAGFAPFLPLNQTLGAITQTAIVGALAVNSATKGSSYVYAMGNLNYYEGSGHGSAFTTRGAASASSNFEKFVQFDDLVVAVGEGHEPKRHTIGSTSAFTTLATNGFAPVASVVGVVNRFVVLGDLTGTAGTTTNSNFLQWSAIDQPTNWPEPNSATAIATQAGQQEMPLAFGAVRAVHGGDQYGVVLQHKGVSRMTYVGPPVVFQFDVIDSTQGCFFPYGSIQVGRMIYFISNKGFCRTNGVTVENIGDGKVDRYFWDRCVNSNFVNFGHDPVNDLIYCSFPTSSSTYNDALIIYNPTTNQFTYGSQGCTYLVTPATGVGQMPRKLMGFSSAGSSVRLGIFEATAGAAVFETGEFELTEAGRTFIDGVKPNVESSATAPSMGVRIGYRDSLGASPTYTTTAAPLARTGVANFRVDAKYLRLETTITGNFRKATGVEFDAEPAGYA
jgi:hypothetical protein